MQRKPREPRRQRGEADHPVADELATPHVRGTAPRAWSSVRRAWGTSALSGIGQDEVLELRDRLLGPLSF